MSDNTNKSLNANVKCRLTDKMSNVTVNYSGAIYTKLDGVYGYLCIDVMSVKFFWVDNDRVCCDDVSDKFDIEYTIK